MLQMQSFLGRAPSAFWLTRSQTQLCCPLTALPGAILGDSALLPGDTGTQDCTLPLQQSEKFGIVTPVTRAPKEPQICRIELHIIFQSPAQPR